MTSAPDFGALHGKRREARRVENQPITLAEQTSEERRFTEMDAAVWMVGHKFPDNHEKHGIATQRIRNEWQLLGNRMQVALDEMDRQIKDPDTAARMKAAVNRGATVGEIASYLLAPRGEITISNQSQAQRMRAIEDRIHLGGARAIGEKSTTLGMMVAIPAVVAGAGIALGTIGIALPLLGISGTIAFVSPSVAAVGGGVAALATPRTVINIIKAKKIYNDLRTKVPNIIAIDPTDPALDETVSAKLNEQLGKIPHCDRHLFKHLGTHETQIFLLGNDETRRSILEDNPPSQIARMEAQISAMDESSWAQFYQFLKENINPGVKVSQPGTTDGGIENLQERLGRWRKSDLPVELPGRRGMLAK